MKKLTIFILLIVIAGSLYAGGQAEITEAEKAARKERAEEIQRNKRHYTIGGAGLLVNGLGTEGSDAALTTISFGLNSTTAPKAGKFGYMGQSILSASLYTTDGLDTDYTRMPVFALDNIIGLGYGLAGFKHLSIGAGLHLGLVNYSSYDYDDSETFVSVGPALMIAVANLGGNGLMIELHHDILLSKGEDTGLNRTGLSVMWGHSF